MFIKRKRPNKRFEAYVQLCLKRFPFYEHSAFKISINLEGYKNCFYGCRAGSSWSVDYLIHDLAHCVEFGSNNFKKRYCNGSFVFKSPKTQYFTCMGRTSSWKDWRTTQATERECRTIGIKLRLEQFLKPNFNLEKQVLEEIDSLKYVSDNINVKSEGSKEYFRNLIMESYNKWSNITEIFQEIESWLDKVKKTKHFNHLIENMVEFKDNKIIFNDNWN